MNDSHSPLMPKARTEQLIVKELADETLVYDLTDDKAHCLNQTAALVWKNCDGKSSVSDIANGLEKVVGSTVDKDVVWLALDHLEKFRLLDTAWVDPPRPHGSMSRRQIVKTLGVAAVALPIIVSLTVPTPAQAVSCLTTNQQSCTGVGAIPCCAGCTCNTANGKCQGGC